MAGHSSYHGHAESAEAGSTQQPGYLVANLYWSKSLNDARVVQLLAATNVKTWASSHAVPQPDRAVSGIKPAEQFHRCAFSTATVDRPEVDAHLNSNDHYGARRLVRNRTQNTLNTAA